MPKTRVYKKINHKTPTQIPSQSPIFLIFLLHFLSSKPYTAHQSLILALTLTQHPILLTNLLPMHILLHINFLD